MVCEGRCRNGQQAHWRATIGTVASQPLGHPKDEELCQLKKKVTDSAGETGAG